jgi:hypothetical protein
MHTNEHESERPSCNLVHVGVTFEKVSPGGVRLTFCTAFSDSILTPL